MTINSHIVRTILTFVFVGIIFSSYPSVFAANLIVKILSPEASPVVSKRDVAINFMGSVTDSEGNNVTGIVLTWESDKDGPLGEGAAVSSFLSDGVHVITLKLTSNDGSAVTDQVIIGVGGD